MNNFRLKPREVKNPINEEIRYNELRVVSNDEQLGVLSRTNAIEEARKRGLDLIVINETASPPIAKILDADKYFYEQKRKEKEAAKKQRESRIEIKEVQFRPGIDKHDFETKIKSIERFLVKGAKVKCMIRFRGRENANKTLGFELMDRIAENLQNTEWDTKPSLNGNRLIGILKRGKNV
jgi:translation initiation factor IF-3